MRVFRSIFHLINSNKHSAVSGPRGVSPRTKYVLHPTNPHDAAEGNLIVSVWRLDPGLYDQYFIVGV